jgi:hypothetical protein
MLKFSNLTLAQKRFIVAVIEHDESIKQTKSITLKQCGEVYDALRAERQGAKGEKIGYPNWLFKANKVSRGVYGVPVPTDAELSAYAKELATKQTSPVTKAKAKVAKLAQAKVIKTKAVKVKAEDESEEDISGSRLNRIIAESEPFDADVEDFNQILRENGIEV